VPEEDGLTMNVVKLMTEDNGLLNAGAAQFSQKKTFRKSMLPS